MKPVTVDAFSSEPFGGNPAGVAVFGDKLPEEAEMRQIAANMGYSETAFILPVGGNEFRIRYFTPVEEVPLCGHATVGSFAYMLKAGLVKEGECYVAKTGAGDINVDIANGLVWLDMAEPEPLVFLNDGDKAALAAAYGISEADMGELKPAISNTGLADIMLPLKGADVLANLKPDMDAIAGLSKKLNVTGVHAFAAESDALHCRNFAPLYGIDEEAATGTSTGALTYYLYKHGIIKPNETNLFIQGEAMGKPSRIYSRLGVNGGAVHIRVGGTGCVRE